MTCSLPGAGVGSIQAPRERPRSRIVRTARLAGLHGETDDRSFRRLTAAAGRRSSAARERAAAATRAAAQARRAAQDAHHRRLSPRPDRRRGRHGGALRDQERQEGRDRRAQPRLPPSRTSRPIPASAYDKVDTSKVSSGPKKVTGSPLTFDGKPGIFYSGAEYCPYCAAQRWPLVVALSRFGTWSNLSQTVSGASSGPFPETPTFSFYGSTYTSPYLAFQSVETADQPEEERQLHAAADADGGPDAPSRRSTVQGRSRSSISATATPSRARATAPTRSSASPSTRSQQRR